jgi:hypothetical protein
MVFQFPPSSITSWEDFEKDFIKKFGERKTTTSLYKELGAIKMDKREKVKEFNQHDSLQSSLSLLSTQLHHNH